MSARIGQYLRANVLGLIAIFIALGGTAVALPGRNTVQSNDIGPGEQVRNSDTKPIQGSWVADDSLTGADVDESSLSGVPGANGGTVTSVGSGAGLTGGPVTGNGTLALAPCPDGQLLKSNGSGYACAADVDTNSGGDITGVGAGGGLAGGGASGDVNLGLLPCPSGQLLKSDGAGAYNCANDIDTDTNSGGDITGVTAGNGLAGGGTNGGVALQVQPCAFDQVLRWGGSSAGWVCSADFWARQITHTSGPTIEVGGGVTAVRVNYSTPTRITGLLNGTPGQHVTLRAVNSNPEIVSSAEFFTAGNASWQPGANDTIQFVAGSASQWFEVARSNNCC